MRTWARKGDFALRQKENTKPARIDLSVQQDRAAPWNGTPADDAAAAAAAAGAKIASAAQTAPQPELHLNADRRAAYGKVARAVSAARRSGLTKTRFVANPVPQR